MAEKRNAFRFLVGKPEENIQFGRLRHRRIGNVKMDLKRTGWEM
jgi:hypothetical protein